MLEKILEEIRAKAIELKNSHWGDDERHLIGKGIESMCVQAENIIHKHMNDDKDTNVPTNDGWIPAEVCPMPENDGVYEVTKLIDGQYETAYIKQEGGWSSCIGPMEGEIVAWKLGPEPYRPEKGGDNSDNNL